MSGCLAAVAARTQRRPAVDGGITGMLKFWQAGVATIAVALLSLALIVLDLSDGAFRR